MKIAIITPAFPPYFSGMGQVAEQEAEGLAKLGYEVMVFTPLYRKGISEVCEELKGYKVKRLKGLTFGNAAWLPSLADELKNFDVIHLHYPFIGAINSVLKSKILNHKSKIIITYHMDLVGRGWRGLFFKLYTRLTLPKIVRAADKIIVSSLDYARHSRLAPYLQKEMEKFVEIPFGIDMGCHPRESGDPENVTSSKAEKSLDSCFRRNDNDRTQFLKNNLGIKEEEKVILFVGGLDKAHYFKGVDVLLKSFQKLCYMSHVICYMLIVGDGDIRSHYEKLAKDLGLADRVIFAGRVPSADLPSYYQLADVLVLPSTTRSEAYGLVVLEAMAAGVPVVASDLPGVRTLIIPERGILVQPGDSGGLSRALSEILSDEEKRKQMGERAREWVKVERMVEKEIAELDKIIKECYKCYKRSS